MKRIAEVISWLALATVVGAPILFFADKMDLDSVKRWMLIATAAWFFATPIWMDHKAT
jgi:hypothetical protein